MSKTPKELAIDYCEPILSDDYAKAIGREDWIGTRCVKVGEGHEMYKAFLAGYQAAAPQWISVRERLPEDASDVLIAWADGVSEACFCDDRWCRDGRMLLWVTHWMPLPNPPEATNER